MHFTWKQTELIIVYGADRGLDIGAHTSHSGKIVGAHKLVCRRLHDPFIQMLGIKPGAVDIKRVLQPGIVDLVGIFLPDTGADGIEILMDFKSLRHHDVTGKMGIHGIGQPLHWDGGGGAEIGHINPGVDTSIGAAAAGATCWQFWPVFSLPLCSC